MNNKGFTLIELVMFIVIGGIFLPASMIAFTSVMNNYSRPDYTIKARFYAEKRISEITNRLYSDIVAGSCSNTDEDEGYTTECSIVTVNPDTLTTTTPDANYKRITVAVKHVGLLTDHIVVTMVAKRPKKTP